MAHMTSEFRFEKYKSAEQAKASLLEQHPVGSPVKTLVATLEKAGAKCGPITNPDYKDKYKGIIYCELIKPSFLSQSEWKVIIYPDESTININSFEVFKHFTAL